MEQRSRSFCKTRRHSRHGVGQSLTEFAVVLPVLLILLAGLIDFGRLFFVYVAITDAAAEGATYGALYPQDRSAILVRAQEATQGRVTLETSQIAIEPETIDPTDYGSLITVTVSYDCPLLTPIVNAFVPGGAVNLSAQVTEVIVENQ